MGWRTRAAPHGRWPGCCLSTPCTLPAIARQRPRRLGAQLPRGNRTCEGPAVELMRMVDVMMWMDRSSHGPQPRAVQPRAACDMLPPPPLPPPTPRQSRTLAVRVWRRSSARHAHHEVSVAPRMLQGVGLQRHAAELLGDDRHWVAGAGPGDVVCQACGRDRGEGQGSGGVRAPPRRRPHRRGEGAGFEEQEALPTHPS